jgi:hypothetical protein
VQPEASELKYRWSIVPIRSGYPAQPDRRRLTQM